MVYAQGVPQCVQRWYMPRVYLSVYNGGVYPGVKSVQQWCIPGCERRELCADSSPPSPVSLLVDIPVLVHRCFLWQIPRLFLPVSLLGEKGSPASIPVSLLVDNVLSLCTRAFCSGFMCYSSPFHCWAFPGSLLVFPLPAPLPVSLLAVSPIPGRLISHYCTKWIFQRRTNRQHY